MDISVNGRDAVIGAGQIVIIRKGVSHSFKANEPSRFLVADTDRLPDNANAVQSPFAAISESMRAYCRFIEVQLQHPVNPHVNDSVTTLFGQLLADQDFVPKINLRITRVLDFIENNLAAKCSLDDLASAANLSKSHFKTEFKKQTGQSTGQYLMMRRMEKARALLTRTDLPIGIVAERVGYTSPSAFTRRYSSYFGKPPKRSLTS